MKKHTLLFLSRNKGKMI